MADIEKVEFQANQLTKDNAPFGFLILHAYLLQRNFQMYIKVNLNEKCTESSVHGINEIIHWDNNSQMTLKDKQYNIVCF